VSNALPLVTDFFDRRTLLAVYQDPAEDDVYSLALLTREGTTTLPGARAQPWQLVVWRWKREGDPPRLMLAGRGFLFRGISGRADPPPAISLDLALEGWEDVRPAALPAEATQ
jgi:hypothetical protein